MTRAEFRARLKALDMTQREFAERAGCKYKTVSDWGKPRGGQSHAFPGWAIATLSAMERSIDIAARYLATEEGAAEALAELAENKKTDQPENNPIKTDFPVDAPG